MKAIILIGGISKWLFPLSHERPRGMLQVGNVPALRHTLQHLAGWGVTEFCVPIDTANRSVRNYFQEDCFEGIKIHYAYTKRFLGTAGSLRLFDDILNDDPFLIANGNSFSRPDLRLLFERPSAGGPFLSVGMYDHAQAVLPESPMTSRRTRKRAKIKLAHMYYADPGILRWIPQNRYFDLREQLVPVLRSNGCVVRDVPLQGRVNELRSFEDYLEANHRMAHAAVSQNLLSSKNVHISKKATLHGSVLIGEGTVVGAHSVVVGPTVIGSRCRIGRGVLIHRSVIESDVRIQNNCRVQSSIVLAGADVEPGSYLLKAIGVNGDPILPTHQQLFKSSPYSRGWEIHHTKHRTLPAPRGRPSRTRFVYLFKRILDVSLTLLVSPLLAPIILLLGFLVKWTSPGPAFFHEIRVGQNGKEFTMHKLRTMINRAHLQQVTLQSHNEGDGPMFKLEDDPRVTPLGRWLRKTSLDELPQFWNVLKGDMSLVGPRPLANREMKWNQSWKEMRLLVKPGITGLWQVSTGVFSEFSDWILYDTYYVRHCRLSLDLKILFLTVAQVLRGRKANPQAL